MKKYIVALLLFQSIISFAQKDCTFDTEISDSLGTYKSLKQEMIFERNFAGNSNRIYFSIALINGIMTLDVELLQQSKDFLKANCFDAGSRIYLQLNNGKIATLMFVGSETCGTLIESDNGLYNRITKATFVFTKDNYDLLKSSKVTFMRIKYLDDTVDLPFKTQFKSELDGKYYKPEDYFIDNLKCFEN
jgi:hypothetical protein